MDKLDNRIVNITILDEPTYMVFPCLGAKGGTFEEYVEDYIRRTKEVLTDENITEA